MNRRDFLKGLVALGAGVVGSTVFITENPISAYVYEKIDNFIAKYKYFDLLKQGERILVGYKNRIFVMGYDLPYPERGEQKLVQDANPNYSDAEVAVYGELVGQLYNNPVLKSLEEGKIARVPFDITKEMGFLDPYTKYPNLTEVGRGSLEDLLKTSHQSQE